MEKVVFCLAKNETSAERIVNQLQTAGFDTEVMSVLYSDSRGGIRQGSPTRKGTMGHEKHTKAPEGATTGAISGGVIGGTLGLLAGLGSLAIPGLGPFIAAGPIMAALSGSAVGGSLGLVVGALVGLGVPEYEARRYQDSLEAGGVLISVHCENSDEVERATRVMKNEGGKEISSTYEKSKSRL